MKRWILGLMISLVGSLAFAQAPTIFFLDLTSGPNSGGENGNGTILTIYGKNFGSTQGSSTVTVGGHAVAAYLQWAVSAPGEENTQKISVAIGSSAATGNVLVTTSAGTSNGITFTVRSGNIDCVSTSGSDSNNGQFSSDPTSRSGTKGCWLTMRKAKNTMAAGDISYVENGESQTANENGNAAMYLPGVGSGSSGSPIALLAYPGASATIGTTSLERAFYLDSTNTEWVIAGFTIQAQVEAFNINGATYLWVEGNDVECPTGASDDACIIGGQNNMYFYGNYIHNTGNGGCSGDCRTYHPMYDSNTNAGTWVAAWNTIVPDPSQTGTGGCKGIEVYSSGGGDQSDVHIHDNIIHDVICDGIDIVAVNPDSTDTMGGQGSVEAYNNIIYRVGTTVPNSGDSDYACFEIGESSAHTNPVEIYNNTMYDCGSRGNTDSGGISIHDSNPKIHFRNNIFRMTGTEPYFTPNSFTYHAPCTQSSGSNNLWYGAGSPPCTTLFNPSVNSDPQFVDPVTARNFHLQAANSPPVGAGTSISTLVYDFDGLIRPSPPSMGVYEFASGGSAPPAPAIAIFALYRGQDEIRQRRKTFQTH
jgi:hypothetical protein